MLLREQHLLYIRFKEVTPHKYKMLISMLHIIYTERPYAIHITFKKEKHRGNVVLLIQKNTIWSCILSHGDMVICVFRVHNNYTRMSHFYFYIYKKSYGE